MRLSKTLLLQQKLRPLDSEDCCQSCTWHSYLVLYCSGSIVAVLLCKSVSLQAQNGRLETG